MKKFILPLATLVIVLSSCGRSYTWDDYKASCVKATSLFCSEDDAKTECDCNIEKYKAAGLSPNDMKDIDKMNSVDISGCSVKKSLF